MNFIRLMASITAYTFTVLALIMAFLFGSGTFDSLPYATVVPALFAMSVGPALVISLRELLLPEDSWYKTLIGVVGCVIVVFAIGLTTGWFQFEPLYLGYVFVITLVVYLMVWLLTMLQSKQDADELNQSLAKISEVDEKK